jgi:serine/threonine protein kinase
MSFDFTPYGYNYTLTNTSPLLKQVSQLASVVSVSKQSLVTKKATYEFEKKLGTGSFGTTYKVVSREQTFAIKKIKQLDTRKLWDSIKEVILQILLYDATKDLSDGPYVPRVFEIAYHAKKQALYIVQEMMDGTLESLINHRTKEENEIKLLDDFEVIAKQLEWLGKHLEFNHRDFKSDNIMYKNNSKGYTLRLIDFGMSCMTWKGIHLQAYSTLYPTSHTCYRSSRDLSALFFEISDYVKSHLSKKTRNLLHEFVILRVNGKNMNMLKELEWQNTYTFLNRKNVENPKTNPVRVQQTIKSSKHQHRYTKKRCRH